MDVEDNYEKYKEEWNSFFWIRFLYIMLVSLILGFLNFDYLGKIVYLLHAGIFYMLSSISFREIFNKDSYSLKLIDLEDSKEGETVSVLEACKIYWPFFWREVASGLLVGLIYWMIGQLIFIILSKIVGIEFILMLSLLIYAIGFYTTLYFVGRKVFIYTVSTCTWSNKAITLE